MMDDNKRGPQKVVLKLRGRKTGLYVKNMFGTRAYGQSEMLKTSALRREMNLRIERRQIKDITDELKGKGMFRWPEFRKERPNFIRLAQSIERSVKIYKARRLEVGMFYLAPCYDTYDITVHSHLLRMPLKEGLKRRRQDTRKRRDILASYNSNNAHQTEQQDMRKRRAILAASYNSNNAHQTEKAPGTTGTEHRVVAPKTTVVSRNACMTTNLLPYTVASIFIGCIIVIIPQR